MESIDYQGNDFYVNGKVLYKGYANKDPRYFEFFYPILGDFKGPGLTGMLLSYENRNPGFASWGQWTELFFPNISELVDGTNWRMTENNGTINTDYEEGMVAKKQRKITNQTSTKISDIIVSPNPAKESIQISFESMGNSEVIIDLLSMTGQVMKNIHCDVAKGQNKLTINNLELLPKGFYILRFQNGTNKVFKKIILH